MSLSKKDLEQLKEHGLTLEKVYYQLKTFSDGIPYVDVVTAASISNGIESISKDDQQKLSDADQPGGAAFGVPHVNYGLFNSDFSGFPGNLPTDDVGILTVALDVIF